MHVKTLRRAAAALLLLDLALVVAHLLWPELEWGQGRSSYFHLGNRQTFASWLVAMELVAVAGLALVAFHRRVGGRRSWSWPPLAAGALGLSFAEFTRLHHRLGWLGGAEPDVYQRLVLAAGGIVALGLVGGLLLDRARAAPRARLAALGWLGAWGLERILAAVPAEALEPGALVWLWLGRGLPWLVGATCLLFAVGRLALGPDAGAGDEPRAAEPAAEPPDARSRLQRLRGLVGVGGTTFCLIALQIVLFQVLTVFGDYLLANSVISIALLGLAVGGLVGFGAARRRPREVLLVASVLLPAGIVLALGAGSALMGQALFASLVLAVPFALCSTVITIQLVRSNTHVVYFVDLAGAALGALVVAPTFGLLREEGSLLALAGLAALVSLLFVAEHPRRNTRRWLGGVMVAVALLLGTLGVANQRYDWLNLVRTLVRHDYPEAEIVASGSSFVGRYDIVRRSPDSTTLKSYENGRVIDTIRPNPPAHYQIDPRLPHTLIDDPTILILGTSGDAITKTARQLGGTVYGVEINPVVVELQQGVLVPHNGNSYEGLLVEAVDGRSYLERYERSYDMITLLNSHFARGRSSGRAPCPEYLHTQEAFSRYLDRLTDRGVVILEEPVGRPHREPPVWKLMVTMRAALLERGVEHPEQHFFVFQWKTKTNNYVQILMKRTPLTPAEVARLEAWLDDVNRIRDLERTAGHRLGPIRSATCTVLYAPHQAPGQAFANNYATLVSGQADPRLHAARKLVATTDDRPFPFDVRPARPELRSANLRTLLLLMAVLPFFFAFVVRHRDRLFGTVPFLLVVTLTGLGYFLVEVVLIQRFEIYLGSPIVTFSTVLGTLLAGSGLGSLVSRRYGPRALAVALGVLVLLLGLQAWVVPAVLARTHGLPLAARVALSVLSLAPLAFVMGMPLPTVLRLGKGRFTPAGAAILFAVNAAASAVAVPLCLDLTTAYGFGTAFAAGAGAYVLTGVLALALERPRLRVVASVVAAACIVALVSSPWLPTQGEAAPLDSVARSESPLRRVYALSYGRSRYRRDKQIHGGASAKTPFEWMFWLIDGPGGPVLVDTGFDDAPLARSRGFTRYERPVSKLEVLGVAPEDVRELVLTHLHWDHVGGLAAFPRARVWIQRAELEHARGRLGPHKQRSKGMRWSDLQALEQAAAEGRLQVIEGEVELLPGVRLVPGGAHTPGAQMVEVDSLDGRVVIGGDTAYLYRNLFRQRATGTNVGEQASLAGLQRMYRRAASPFYALPGHDPRVLRYFKPVGPGVVRIEALPTGEERP